jgi:pimeloyl-ACP methyl ester carboxylesterase
MTKLGVTTLGSGPSALLIHGSFSWAREAFASQLCLADSYELVLVDRCGFGTSRATGDGWPQDSVEIAALLGELGGAHLVGHSYGGLVALLAAGLCPSCVHSLVVIEPPLYGLCPEDAAVQQFMTSLKPLFDAAPKLATSAYAVAFGQAGGMDADAAIEWVASFTPDDWVAAEASRLERWPGDAEVRTEILARASFPKLVVRGGWPTNPDLQHVHSALTEVLARRINGDVVVFDQATHHAQLEQQEKFNAFLKSVWSANELESRLKG